nr:AAA family ATPase [Candidatus Cloacimonadota bacterium]
MKEIIKTIIRDFHEKLPIPNITLRELEVPIYPKQIITLVGPRRCGKTYYFYSLINKLIADGIDRSLIFYFNFEDERFDLSSEDLQTLIDAYFELYPQNIEKKIYLFFDEIHEVDNWEKFIRRIKDTFAPYIFITGSSSKMLSTDIATTLR